MADKKLSSERELIFRLSLISWVLDHPGAKISEAAKFFNVSEATVAELFANQTTVPIPDADALLTPNNYIDINWDALDLDGELEINSHPGMNRVPKLNQKEFAALISGLQFLKFIASTDEIPVINSLLSKLKTGSTNEQSSVYLQEPPTSSNIDAIREALSTSKVMEITYATYDGSITNRTIEPTEIYSLEGRWYLQSWCRLRNAPRSFRIDQIQDAKVINEVFKKRNFFNNWERSFASEQAVFVQLEVDPIVLSFISDWNFRQVDPKIIEIPVYHFHSIKRLIAKFPGKIRIIAPYEAVVESTKWSNDALKNYSK